MPRDFPNARHPLGVERIIAPMVRSLPKDTLPYPQGNARRSGSGAGLDLVFSVRSCIQAPLWLRPCCSVGHAILPAAAFQAALSPAAQISDCARHGLFGPA